MVTTVNASVNFGPFSTFGGNAGTPSAGQTFRTSGGPIGLM